MLGFVDESDGVSFSLVLGALFDGVSEISVPSVLCKSTSSVLLEESVMVLSLLELTGVVLSESLLELLSKSLLEFLLESLLDGVEFGFEFK